MTYFNECDICDREVQTKGLDDSDYAGLLHWHNTYHR